MSFEDITEELRKLSKALPPDVVAMPPNFLLFEGTHALEVTDPIMDTSMLKIPQEENSVANFDFDTTSELNIDLVLVITDLLFRLFYVWLENNEPLTTTVLSCIYVERLLLNYTNKSELSLGHHTSQDKLEEIAKDDENMALTHIVLRSAIIGVIFYVRFVISMGQAGVLFEEEDVVLKFPNLNLLDLVDSFEASKHLVQALVWLMKHKMGCEKATLLSKYLALLRGQIELTKAMERLHEIGLVGNVWSKQSVSAPLINTSFLKNMIVNMEAIVASSDLIPQPKSQWTTKCFLQGIQKRLDNLRPLNALASPDNVLRQLILEKYFLGFLKCFEDLNTLVPRCTGSQIWCFLHKFYLNSVRNNVILNAFLQLFFFRNNKSILGSSKVFLSDLVLSSITSYCAEPQFVTYFFPHRNFNVVDTNAAAFASMADECASSQSLVSESARIFVEHMALDLELAQVADSTRTPLKHEMARFMETLEGDMYHLITAVLNNPSRQRQTLSKLIVLFDLAQVQAESLDQIFPESVLSGYVNHVKLLVMAEFLVKGTCLEVYEPWELLLVYWYTGKLQLAICSSFQGALAANTKRDQQYAQLSRKIASNQLNDSDVHRLAGKYAQNSVFRRHLATLGYTETFTRHKEEFLKVVKEKLRVLDHTKRKLQVRGLMARAAQQVCASIFSLLSVYHKLGFVRVPAFTFVSELLKEKGEAKPFAQKLYELRFKSFSTVGVPEFMSYETFLLELKSVQDQFSDDKQVNLTKVTLFLKETGRLLESAHDFCETCSGYWKRENEPLESAFEQERVAEMMDVITRYNTVISRLIARVEEWAQKEGDLLPCDKLEKLANHLKLKTEGKYYPVVELVDN